MAAGWTRHTPPVAVMNSNYERLEEDTPTPSRPGAYDPYVPAPAAAAAPAGAVPTAVAVPAGAHGVPVHAQLHAASPPTAMAVPAGAHGVPVHAQLHAASAGMYPVVMPDLPDAVDVSSRPSLDTRSR